jgi:dipeptidyl aminopeptidase/acylaminoacyl peptidase
MSLPVAHAGSRELLLGPDPTPELERAHSPQFNVPADAPPHFLLHAEDDDAVVVENTLLMRSALQARGIPVETHLFANGGHGFGLKRTVGKPVAVWPELFMRWAGSSGLL